MTFKVRSTTLEEPGRLLADIGPSHSAFDDFSIKAGILLRGNESLGQVTPNSDSSARVPQFRQSPSFSREFDARLRLVCILPPRPRASVGGLKVFTSLRPVLTLSPPSRRPGTRTRAPTGLRRRTDHRTASASTPGLRFDD
jgi:hypothetical protein